MAKRSTLNSTKDSGESLHSGTCLLEIVNKRRLNIATKNSSTLYFIINQYHSNKLTNKPFP
jgi:hypothetical protein